MLRRVLVTGHEGYIGSVLVPVLLKAGYEVVGLEVGYFSGCTLVPADVEVAAIRKDLRDVGPADLEGFDSVVHLGALSNDPLGQLNADWTSEINFHASVKLARLAKAAGVGRFLFSSSCIMYGVSELAEVSEDSPLDPKTSYAASKVNAERGISALAGDGFSPVFLRNGTVYGLSPRMRFDTVLNNLVGAALATGEVAVFGDGTPWRPVVHVQDVARSFLAVLEAPVAAIHNQAFNNGADCLNHQIMELAEIVLETVPGSRLKVLSQPGADQRTYKADFGKFARVFPGFKFEWTPREGARELCEAFRRVRLTYHDFADRRFTRLRWLQYLLEAGHLDRNLRWANHGRVVK